MGVLSEAGGIHKKMNIVFLCLQKHEALKKTGTMHHTQTPAFSLYLSIKQQVESIYISHAMQSYLSRKTIFTYLQTKRNTLQEPFQYAHIHSQSILLSALPIKSSQLD